MRTSNIKRVLIGFFINCFIFAIAFYFAFAYCVIWKEMQMTILCGLGISLICDMLLLEVMTELIICIFYCFRNVACLGSIWRGLDKYRNFKALIPL